MCIFSKRVDEVSSTKIFVGQNEETQCCVYSMNAKINEPLAMILPIPVAKIATDAVEFVSLENYPKFFDDLKKCWEEPRSRSLGVPKSISSDFLKVHDVGQYVASYVPQLELFSRLDPVFRLPDNTLTALKGYKDFGFVVFQLKPSANKLNFHPMAFKYEPKNKEELFFPTVHIHDGSLYHETESYDHVLYAQPTEFAKNFDWQKCDYDAKQFVDIDETKGLVHPTNTLYRSIIRGDFANNDYLYRNGTLLTRNPLIEINL